MVFKFILLGIFVKIVTGFDDTITHIPIITSITKTRKGKIAFTAGMFLAIILAIIIAMFFSTLLKSVPFYKEIFAGLLFGLAIAIFFDILVHKPRAKAEHEIMKYKKKIPTERIARLLFVGFIASFATVLDDIITYSPLFTHGFLYDIFAIIGILAAALLELLLVLYFSEKLTKFKHKEKIASVGLVILGILILTGII
ncbi:hypothetical protein KY340_01635 [Candidatus Woesearchaeota archaeon]|nr:hypothetical protein [Candidatus Woesearchaeota archaeon]